MSDPYRDEKRKGGVTYAHQDSLPKLPIPDLESTCQKYLTALKPLQSPREHAETKRAVESFLKNEGPELQEKLKKYAEARTSYIEQFCKPSNYTFPFVPSSHSISPRRRKERRGGKEKRR